MSLRTKKCWRGRKPTPVPQAKPSTSPHAESPPPILGWGPEVPLQSVPGCQRKCPHKSLKPWCHSTGKPSLRGACSLPTAQKSRPVASLLPSFLVTTGAAALLSALLSGQGRAWTQARLGWARLSRGRWETPEGQARPLPLRVTPAYASRTLHVLGSQVRWPSGPFHCSGGWEKHDSSGEGEPDRAPVSKQGRRVLHPLPHLRGRRPPCKYPPVPALRSS